MSGQTCALDGLLAVHASPGDRLWVLATCGDAARGAPLLRLDAWQGAAGQAIGRFESEAREWHAQLSAGGLWEGRLRVKLHR